MSRYLYITFSYLLVPLLVLKLILRSRRSPAYGLRRKERFGFFTSPDCTADSQKCLWIHAVSVGEVVAAAPLIEYLQREYPQIKLVVTTMTPTGSERLTSLFGNSIFHVYAPYDHPPSVKRFLKKIRPDFLLIMETELWPNTIRLCRQRNCQVVLVNGRLSPKSAQGYARFSGFSKGMLNDLSAIIAQTKSDAQRFIKLGFDNKKIHISGNIKFNTVPDATVCKEDFHKQIEPCVGRPIFIAASTRAGEEEKVLTAYARCVEIIPDLLLVLVPRHPERFKSTEQLCLRHSLNVVTRSSREILQNDTQVWLGDSMGEMSHYYQMADVVFVGGSLVDTGCQNVVEPAAMGKPILVGPSQFNFQFICEQLESAGGLKTVEDEEELAAQVIKLFSDQELRKKMSDAGLKVVSENSGALDITIQVLKSVIKLDSD